MKILFLTRLYYPHIGGVEKHVEEISRRLSKESHEVTIITTRHDKNLRFNVSIYGNKIIRFDQPTIKYIGLLYTWYWMVKNIGLFMNSDVVHIHDVFVWYWPIRLLLPSKKVYVTLHGHSGKYPLGIIDVLQKKVASWLSTDYISIGNYVYKYYGIKERVTSFGAVNLPAQKNVGNKSDDILYVGRLDESLPLRKYFAAYEKISKRNNIKIVFCGDGELKHEAEKHGKVYGFIDPSKYYRKAKNVFASGYLTILEGLANRCLVFATYNNDLQKDYYDMTPFRDFIIIEKKVSELCKKFIYFQNHRKEANYLIDQGYLWAKTQNWDSLTDKYLKMWSTIN